MTAETRGFDLTAILLIVFITLKMAGLVTWSWWWVLLGPIAITLGMIASIFAVGVIVLALGYGLKALFR